MIILCVQYKKRPIEQSSKLLKNGLKTLEGKLFDVI